MPQKTKKLISARGRRRILVSLAETKTLRLFQEGQRLLAIADFEHISIAQLSKAAGISVGAFYVRFSEKDAFLDFVTFHTFLTSQQRFSGAREPFSAISRLREEPADALVAQFANDEFAGVVRLSVKRGMSNWRHREAFDMYRSFVVDQMAEILSDSSDRNQKAELAIAIQASLGILTDAVISWNPTQPLSLSDCRDTIVRLLSGPLGTTKLRKSKLAKEPTHTHIKKV